MEFHASASFGQVNPYYANRLESLRTLFSGKEISLSPEGLQVDERVFPILEDVIISLDPGQYPPELRDRLKPASGGSSVRGPFAEDIQFTYGECWKKYAEILPEHDREFGEYFDLVNLEELAQGRVLDLGCGMGRWSYLLLQKIPLKELVLVDFSEAIFVARNLMREADNAIFIMGDITRIPFQDNCVDFLFCLGVLHHLPSHALDEVRRLKRLSPRLLIYLYYALDNRPAYFKALLRLVTVVRQSLCAVRNPTFRSAFCWLAALLIYKPMIVLGTLMKPLGLSRFVPLAGEHHWVSMEGLRHHVYDRFFTRIEQRFSRKDIMELQDTFDRVIISDNPGYWHFLCESD